MVVCCLYLQFETVSLQMVVVTDDVDTYAMYIYGDMQWGITPQVWAVLCSLNCLCKLNRFFPHKHVWWFDDFDAVWVYIQVLLHTPCSGFWIYDNCVIWPMVWFHSFQWALNSKQRVTHFNPLLKPIVFHSLKLSKKVWHADVICMMLWCNMLHLWFRNLIGINSSLPKLD